MEENKCPFCIIPSERKIIIDTKLSFCIYDNFPVSKGHCLVIPKRHSTHYLELTVEEKQDMWNLVDKVLDLLKDMYKPDGFNVGFNIGKAAGQTVFHTHIHVIPRYKNDIIDPSGGIRNVFPEKGKYK